MLSLSNNSEGQEGPPGAAGCAGDGRRRALGPVAVDSRGGLQLLGEAPEGLHAAQASTMGSTGPGLFPFSVALRREFSRILRLSPPRGGS